MPRIKIPQITYYQRKKYPFGNFSIEFIFEDVRSKLKNTVTSQVAISTFHSQGIIKRIYNILEAPFKQGDINHITGDIHYVAFLLNKHKTILTIHDCGFLNHRNKITFFIFKFFWLTLPIKRVKYVTANSNFTKNDILRHIPCDPDKIKVIPVAINERFTYIPKEFNSIKPDLLQIGSAPNKNLTRIIEAIKDLNVHLSIIGVVTDANKQLMATYGIDHTTYTNLSDEEVMARYVDSDILLFPSTFEGFGMPILEAQAVGRPVITSNVCSMPEVAGDAACIVDPFDVGSIRDGIERIIRDTAYRENLVLAGVENVKRYNPTLIANMYYDLYQSIYTK